MNRLTGAVNQPHSNVMDHSNALDHSNATDYLAHSNVLDHSNALDHSNINDPTEDEKDALAGVGEIPSVDNPYVTDDDIRPETSIEVNFNGMMKSDGSVIRQAIPGIDYLTKEDMEMIELMANERHSSHRCGFETR